MGTAKQTKISNTDLTEIILETLRGSEDGRTMKVRILRKHVLMSAYQSSETDVESDKLAKKQFKKTIQALEASQEKVLTLTEDGIVTLLPAKKNKKKSDKKKKRQKDLSSDDDRPEISDDSNRKHKKAKTDDVQIENNDNIDLKPPKGSDDEDHQDPIKNKPCDGNPTGCTRLFIGNLPFAVDDVALSSHFAPSETTHIKWITDKETGRFYGSTFVEMKNSRDAAMAVTTLNESQLMGRLIKINYAPARVGDVWPPTKEGKVVTGGQAGTAKGVKSMSEKPPECKKLFIGNLSYDIDDDAIYKFFAAVDAEIKAVRWLSHKETGDFKGCGFVEFWTTEACDKGATLNGKNLLGRPIRIDWTE